VLRELPPIEGVAAATAGFAGTEVGGSGPPRLVTSWHDIEHGSGGSSTLQRMVRGFFDNGGKRAYVARTVDALDPIDEIALLCPKPEDTEEAISQCDRRRDRVAILSLPAGLDLVEDVLAARPVRTSPFAALHHPWVWVAGELTPPGGHVAGIHARRDLIRATLDDEELQGLDDPPLERSLSPGDTVALTEGAVNSLRDLRSQGRGIRLQGSRTLDPDPEWHYVNVRRLFIFLEHSIDRGTQWAVFEPNGEELWTSVRMAITDFLLAQWEAGKLAGQTPDQAFFVRCDRTTMTQDDLDTGRLVCLVGVAPLRPAEFVTFRIGQWTADHGP
jgi:phage tail sheath protein FI